MQEKETKKKEERVEGNLTSSKDVKKTTKLS